MLDDRPWDERFYPLLRVLAAKEPELQKNLGMQRKCEHDLVLQVVQDYNAATYVEIGSGNGILLTKVKNALPESRVIGFEISPSKEVLADCKKQGIDFRSQDVFSDKDLFRKQVKEFIDESAGPIVVYTDNGFKPEELEMVSKHMRPGDICGSHDFSGSNWAAFVPFLKKRNFATMKRYEPYILAHLCLQRFWMKQAETVLEEPCAPCI